MSNHSRFRVRNAVRRPQVHRIAATCCLAAVGFTTGCATFDSDAPTRQVTMANLNGEESQNPTTDPDSPCAAHAIDGSINSTESGAGHTVYTIALTNTGPACTMFGYPGVSLTDSAGAQVGAAARRDTGNKPLQIRLESGEAAEFMVRVAVPYTHSLGECQPTEQTSGMKIYPPNDSGFLTLDLSVATCANPRVITMDVGSVYPAS